MELFCASKMDLKEGQMIYYVSNGGRKEKRFVRGDSLYKECGTRALTNIRKSFIEMYTYAEEEKPLITMDGEYAFAKDPHTPVRVLCVDRNSKWKPPVVILCKDGGLYYNEADGTNTRNMNFSLVPLKKKHTVWCLFRKDGSVCCTVDSEESAKRTQDSLKSSSKGPYTIVKMVEAED